MTTVKSSNFNKPQLDPIYRLAHSLWNDWTYQITVNVTRLFQEHLIQNTLYSLRYQVGSIILRCSAFQVVKLLVLFGDSTVATSHAFERHYTFVSHFSGGWYWLRVTVGEKNTIHRLQSCLTNITRSVLLLNLLNGLCVLMLLSNTGIARMFTCVLLVGCRLHQRLSYHLPLPLSLRLWLHHSLVQLIEMH